MAALKTLNQHSRENRRETKRELEVLARLYLNAAGYISRERILHIMSRHCRDERKIAPGRRILKKAYNTAESEYDKTLHALALFVIGEKARAAEVTRVLKAPPARSDRWNHINEDCTSHA